MKFGLHNNWKKDPTLKNRTVLPVEDIILLLEFCLKNMYFSFQDQFYEQVKGVAMGSPDSPTVANLHMDYFEHKALSIAPTSKTLAEVCDDTFVIQKGIHKQDFLQHINSVDPTIQFTVENNKEDGAIPFLDTTVKPDADATNETKTKGHIAIPYTQGLCENIKKICGRYGIQTYSKVVIPSGTYWSPQGQRS